MNYTREEYNLISNAMTDVSTYLDTAYANLWVFYETYFENNGDRKHLASELEYRPEIVEGQIHGIIHALCEAKIELDVFVNTQSSQLCARISNTAKMEQLITQYNRRQ